VEAQVVPQIIEVEGYGKVEVPDGMTPEQVLADLPPLAGDAPVPASGGIKKWLTEESPLAYSMGALKGIGSTLYGASATVNKYGGDAIRNKLAQMGTPGAAAADAALDQFYAKHPEVLEAKGRGQQTGKVVGETLPYLAPGGAIARAGKVAQAATGSRVVGGLARAGLEGASAGVITGAQSGGDLGAAGESAALATGLTAGMGAVGAGAGKVIEKMAKQPTAQEIASGAVVRPASQAIADFLTRRAQKSYASMLGAGRGQKKAAMAVAEGLVDRAAMFRSAGNMADQTEANIERLAAAKKLIEEATQADRLVNGTTIEELSKRIDTHAATAFMTETPQGIMTVLPQERAAMQELGELKKVLGFFADESGFVNVKWLEKAKQKIQKWADLDGAYNPDKATQVLEVQARKDVAKIVMQEFDELVPDIGRINKEISFEKRVLDFAVPLEARNMIQQYGAAGAGGGILGGGYAAYRVTRGDDPGEALTRGFQLGVMSAGVGGLVRSVAWKSVNGAAKAHIADLIAAGKHEKATEIMRRIAVAQQGRPDSGASGY
jgi:hypothetical protein